MSKLDFLEGFNYDDIMESHINQSAVQKKCIHKQCTHIASIECKKYAVPICYECENKIHKNCKSFHQVLREFAQSDDELLVKINLFDESINRVHLFIPTSEFETFLSKERRDKEIRFSSKFRDDSEDSQENKLFLRTEGKSKNLK